MPSGIRYPVQREDYMAGITSPRLLLHYIPSGCIGDVQRDNNICWNREFTGVTRCCATSLRLPALL